MKRLIITNNPKTAEFVRKDYIQQYPDTQLLVCGSQEETYTQVRDHIHRQWRLLNHALYGNIQLHKQPYRSMILMECPEIDMQSLQMWEHALARVHCHRLPDYPLHVLEDFQELDFSLFSSSL